jgi:hypothetical protein
MPWPDWFELAVVFGLAAVGNILLGHFEAGRPKWRRVLKVGLAGALAVAVSSAFGRIWFFALLGALLVTVVEILPARLEKSHGAGITLCRRMRLVPPHLPPPAAPTIFAPTSVCSKFQQPPPLPPVAWCGAFTAWRPGWR